MKDTYFAGKTAVVTGAGGTLCSVIARDLADKGARVVLVGRTMEKLEAAAEKIRADGGVCRCMTADVTDEAAMEEIGRKVQEEWGPCRFLVNGAGGNNNRAITAKTVCDAADLDNPDAGTDLFRLDMEVFDSVVRINTTGTVIPVRVFGKQMVRAGEGGILNFASMNSYRPLTRVPAYALSKAAVVNLTQWLAVYFANTGIRVNAVAPGFFINDRSVKILGTPETGLTARGEQVISHTPMGRFGQAADLLGAVEYLLDDRKAAYVTGITLPVDGGFLSHAGV